MSVIQAHLCPTSAVGDRAEALCGYRLTGATPPDDAEVCARCSELAAAPTPSALLVTITAHAHEWVSAGAVIHPGGWVPAYRCEVCGDEVSDLGLLRNVGRTVA